MKTDNLIDLLTQDAPVRLRLGRMLAAALVIGIVCSAIILVATIGIRPHIVEALKTIRVVFKIAVTLILGVTASVLVFNIGRPGVPLRPYAIALFIPLGLLLAGLIIELSVVPVGLWERSMVGRYSNFCMLFVPVLSLAPFLAFFWALKNGAPENPGLAGAAVGLAAGGIGAAIYAWHCPDDSPLFVACWYMLAIAMITIFGFFAGRRWLAW